MPIEKYGRKVFREKDITLRSAETGDKVTKTVLFSNMLWSDLKHMQEIHNRVWAADKYPALGLSMAQFESYYENFNNTSIAAVIVEGDDPAGFIPVGGINAMRINVAIDKSGPQPDPRMILKEIEPESNRWNVGELDDLPLSWDACTNAGWFDTAKARGVLDHVWPRKNGKTLICPTVYVKPVVKIGGTAYGLGSLMKEIILSVDSVAQETCEREKRSMHIMAYSAPRDLYKWSKTYQDLGEPKLGISKYFLSSQANGQVAAQEKHCVENGITGKERMRLLYVVYQRGRGILSLDEFEARDIPYFALMNLGMGAYIEYVEKFGLTDVEDFLCATGRRMLDGVIGRHVSFGARIGKDLPGARGDPNAIGHNTLMLYRNVVPKRDFKSEAILPSTKIEDSTL